MHERTFLAAMIGLDVMLILAGGAMGWGYGGRGSVGTGLLSMALIGMIGGFAIYHLNVFVFDLAESGTSARDAAWVTAGFAGAVLIGGLAAI